MIRVALFSNQFASSQGHGIARYSKDLVGELQRQRFVDAIPVAGWSSLSNDSLRELQGETDLRLTRLGRRGTALLWTYLDAPLLERLIEPEPDVVHALSLGYPVATRKPLVVTVHDLGPLTHPEYFSNTRPWVMGRSLAQAHRKADAIICVSRSTAAELEEYVGNGIGARIHVIAEGVSPEFSESVDPACLFGLDLPPSGVPFILTAGKISPRKNVQGVLRAMSAISGEVPHHLVLVGGSGWDVEIVLRELRDAPDLSTRVHFAGYVSDLQLRALYSMASVYVHPSYYEGFGLTVLEAMACGTPVVASDRTSLPEVVGAAGRLVDPDDPSALAEAIVEICLDPSVAGNLSDAGRDRAAKFTWEECAAKVARVYADVGS